MTRRAVVCLFAAACAVYGLDRSEVLETVAPLASALSQGDAEGFVLSIAKDAPDRDRLADNVRGLLAQAEITCSVEVTEIQGDTAELSWYMELRSKQTQTVSERRKGAVKVRIVKRQIKAIGPAGFFAPAPPSAL